MKLQIFPRSNKDTLSSKYKLASSYYDLASCVFPVCPKLHDKFNELADSIMRHASHDELIDRRLRLSGALLCPLPSHEPEVISDKITRHCVNSKVIRKFCKATGKVEKIITTCGKCTYCRHRRQNELIFRIYMHCKKYRHSLFVTLTYNNEHYPLCPEYAKSDLLDDAQRFYKRLRKRFGNHKFNYYHVAERGKTSGRLHHHFILFWNGLSVETVQRYINQSWCDVPRVLSQEADSSFIDFSKIPSKIGFTYFGEVNNKSIAYVTKYMNKGANELTVYQTWSKGLGKNIIFNDEWKARLRYQNLIDYQPDPKGKRYYLPVPRYYKTYVFRQDELDALFRSYLNSESYEKRLEYFRNAEKQKLNDEEYIKYCNYADTRQHALDKKRQARGTDI